MKSWEEAEEEGSMLWRAPVRRGQGKMSPGLMLPSATSAACRSYGGSPREVLLTMQMQTGEVPVQPYGACSAWANTGDSLLWAPTHPHLGWSALDQL